MTAAPLSRHQAGAPGTGPAGDGSAGGGSAGGGSARGGSAGDGPARDGQPDVAAALRGAAARGHFRFESGDHGDLWLDLDVLLADAGASRGWASALASRAAPWRAGAVCGPLAGGAFLALLVAAELSATFVPAERGADPAGGVRYRIPPALRSRLSGRRVLLVDDAVNAGSALLSTLAAVEACGGEPVGFASLIALGDAPARLEAARGPRPALPFVRLADLDRALWRPEVCPLCAAGLPLDDPSRPESGPEPAP